MLKNYSSVRSLQRDLPEILDDLVDSLRGVVNIRIEGTTPFCVQLLADVRPEEKLAIDLLPAVNVLETSNIIEPPRDNTNQMSVRPAKTQISLGIRPVWSESSLSTWRNIGSSATHWAHCADSDHAQVDLSLRWTQRSFCWFCHEAAQMILLKHFKITLCCNKHDKQNDQKGHAASNKVQVTLYDKVCEWYLIVVEVANVNSSWHKERWAYKNSMKMPRKCITLHAVQASKHRILQIRILTNVLLYSRNTVSSNISQLYTML